jgi:SAM-dependent methyltransferase
MGVHWSMIRYIIDECKYMPIRGSVLLIGRQTVHITPAKFYKLLYQEGMQVNTGAPITLDTYTRAGAKRGLISDYSFFKILGADHVSAMDVSDYEGADIIHNLDTPIPTNLEGKFDFIFNGSVLDNVFDPVMALKNISRMLAPNGRVIHFEHASNCVNNAYLQFSPNWFFDYYVINGYSDCKTYLAIFDDLDEPWSFYACIHANESEPSQFASPHFAMTAVTAEKCHSSSWNRNPIQGQYRSRKEWDEYMNHLQFIERSVRPVLGTRTNLHRRFSIALRFRARLKTLWKFACSDLKTLWELICGRKGRITWRRVKFAIKKRFNYVTGNPLKQGYLPLGTL